MACPDSSRTMWQLRALKSPEREHNRKITKFMNLKSLEKFYKIFDIISYLTKYDLTDIQDFDEIKINFKEDPIFKDLKNFITRRYQHQGAIKCSDDCKALRRAISKNLAAESISLPFTKVNSLGYPKPIGFELSKLLKQRDRHYTRMALTLLQVSYMQEGGKPFDLNTITASPSIDEATFLKLQQFSLDYSKKIFKFPSYGTGLVDYHTTTSAGPVTGNALWSATYEISMLSLSTLNCVKALSGDFMYNRLQSLKQYNDCILEGLEFIGPKVGKLPKRKKDACLRKLSIIPSPEGKTRIVAILDYWSQQSLLRLHNISFEVLRSLGKTDATFNQSSGSWDNIDGDDIYHSFDLTSATDLFPVRVQEMFLSQIYGDKIASAWREILTREPYSFKGKSYKYNTGQPMGAYSSWGVFSLCHHLIIRYSAHLAGYQPEKFTKYKVLGDDVVISNSKVAHHYLQTMSSLGVPINLNKSYVSHDTYEFAKRLFHAGEEWSAFPINAVMQSRKSASSIWSTLLISRERRFNLVSHRCVPPLVSWIQQSVGCSMRSTERIVEFHEAWYTILTDDYGDKPWAYELFKKILKQDKSCLISEDNFNIGLTSDIKEILREYAHATLKSSRERYYALAEELYSRIASKATHKMFDSMTKVSGEEPLRELDLLDVPFLNILSRETDTLWRELGSIQYDRDRALSSLSKALTSAVDVSRIISRRNNTRVLSRQGQLYKYLRTYAAAAKSRNDA
jgi:hypothetical protein